MAQQILAGSLAVPASVAAGAVFRCDHLRGRLVQVSGTFTATVAIEGSVDGTNFTVLGAALTAPGYRVVEDGWVYVRANTTAYTSGTPVAKMGGMY